MIISYLGLCFLSFLLIVTCLGSSTGVSIGDFHIDSSYVILSFNHFKIALRGRRLRNKFFFFFLNNLYRESEEKIFFSGRVLMMKMELMIYTYVSVCINKKSGINRTGGVMWQIWLTYWQIHAFTILLFLTCSSACHKSRSFSLIISLSSYTVFPVWDFSPQSPILQTSELFNYDELKGLWFW